MLLSYEDFRGHFERRGISEERGRAILEALETIIDPFMIAAIEGNTLEIGEAFDSDSAPFPVQLGHSNPSTFNSAAHDSAAGKKET